MKLQLALLWAKWLVKRGTEPPTACYESGLLFRCSGAEIWNVGKEWFETKWRVGRMWKCDPLGAAMVMMAAGEPHYQSDPIVFDLGHMEKGDSISLDLGEPTG